MAIFPGSAIPSGAAAAYEIDNSVRFWDGDSAYLNRTPGSDGNLRTWTLSCWIKRVEQDDAGNLLDAGPTPGTNLFTNVYITNEDKIATLDYDTVGGSGVVWYLISTAKFRDPSAWYHLVVAVDTTQAVDSNRVKVYMNGEQITDFVTETYPPINTDSFINDNIEHRIGQYMGSGQAEFWNGYLAEYYLIDGTQLAPSDFGELSSTTNQWIPLDSDGVKDAVTFGTNGFFLDFSDGADFGDDDSGEGNDWTVNNLVATDKVLDSPTNNWATLNPLQTNGTLSEGNLKCATTTTQRVGGIATIAPQSGKWYFEGYLVSYITAPVWMFGVTGRPTEDWRNDYAVGAKSWSYSYDCSTGVAYNNDVSVPEANPYGATAAAGDVIGIALDLDNYELYFSKNGTWQNSANPASGTGGIGMTTPDMQADTSYELSTYVFATGDGSATKGTTQVINFGQDSSFAANKTSGSAAAQDSNGRGDFYYTPPASFLALCSDNLPSPDIALPGKHFNTVLYTGTGSELAITGVGFQPDFTWIKTRTLTYNHRVFDSVRAQPYYELYPNAANAQVTDDAQTLKSFDSDGFTLGTSSGVNPVSTMVSWNWKESATAGFDIVAYTGNGAARTISHSLGVVPELIIIKGRDVVEDWLVGSVQQGLGTGRMYLSTNAATSGSYAASLWNSTAATSSVFSVGDSAVVNTNTKLYIAYLFANIDGFSKISSYKGNGAAAGPFIYTGFKPKFVIAKNMDLTDDWEIYDAEMNPYNYLDLGLKPNTSAAQYALYTNNRAWDFLSNGFKVRGSNAGINTSGDNILYIAFAESPFKYSNAR